MSDLHHYRNYVFSDIKHIKYVSEIDNLSNGTLYLVHGF